MNDVRVAHAVREARSWRSQLIRQRGLGATELAALELALNCLTNLFCRDAPSVVTLRQEALLDFG